MSSSIKRRWFGTDGIRGAFGKSPMTPEFIWRCGRATAELFGKGEYIVGRDTRDSGPILEEALTQGIQSGGGKVFHAGVLPTAAIASFTAQRRAPAGIMISASHNPHEDNGIKFFGRDGFKFNDDDEIRLEEKIELIPEPFLSRSQHPLTLNHDTEVFYIYREMLLKSLPKKFSLQNLRVIIDAANGAAFQSAPQILLSLGARVSMLAEHPDGKNINAACGCLHPQALRRRIKASREAIGIAHDGDADRLLMVDEHGETLDGDDIMAIIALDYLKENKLAKNTLVATSMSNRGLDETLKEHGGKILRTDVGDRNVIETMRREKLNFGGEPSGHMLFLDYFTTGDGLLSALQALKVMIKTGKPLKELRKVLHRYPQLLESFDVMEKKPIESMPAVVHTLKECEKSLGETGRVVLRYSGTENKIRLLLEARDSSALKPLREKILLSFYKENLIEE